MPWASVVGTKYAVLFSGGICDTSAHYRYWNNIIYMYFILRMHGYAAENIYVLYKDGVGEDENTPVNYGAGEYTMDTVFEELSVKMTSRDTFFFFVTNHGDRFGINAWGGGGGYFGKYLTLNHSRVAGWLDSITCANMIVIMNQCYAGDYIPYISAPNRVILTACEAGTFCYSCDDEGAWSEYVYHFMSALIGIKLPGAIGLVDADSNNDGLISIYEAHIYAVFLDSRDETPMYDDDGDGIGLDIAELLSAPGPFYGYSIYL